MPVSRESSFAQLRAATAAFAADAGSGTSAVETARSAGIRVLSSQESIVSGPPDTHGREHDVWIYEDEGVRRVCKITRGQHTLYGISGSAECYLRRWLDSNLIFGDDIRIEGILPNGRFMMSQLFIEGSVPSTIQLHQALEIVGWRPYRNSGTVWTSPDGRIVMSEVHNGNFIQRSDGGVSAIDVALHSNEEWAAQLDADEYAEAYGPEHQPRILTELIDAVNGDLCAFGFESSQM